MKVLQRNTRTYLSTQLFHSLVFTIPIWIVYYQGFLTAVEISILVAFQYLLQLVMELPSGAFADMIGRKRSLHIAFLIGAISFLLFPFAREFWHFMVLAALVGISDSFRSGSEEALIYDSFKQANKETDFEKVYARGNLFYQVGLIVGTLSGGFLYEINQFLPFILYGISMLVGFFATLVYVEPRIDSEVFTWSGYVNKIKTGTREAFKDKLTTYTSLYYVAVGTITWTNALYFSSFFAVGLGFTDSERGLVQGGVRLINALAITYVLTKIKISDKFKILFFPVIMIIGFLPGVAVSGWFGVPFLQLAMLAGTCRWIFLTPITNRVFSSSVRATAISVLSLLIGIGYIIITTASGPIIENYGIGFMYTILGLLTIITVVPLAVKLLSTIKTANPTQRP